MGWILSIAFLIVAALTGGISGNAALIASALFAIAGSIAFASHAEVRLKEQKQDKQN
jgi:hypothetical protein